MAKHNVWTEAEIELLKSWVGKKPLQQIQQEWNAIAIKKGWRERSKWGIEVKLKRLCVGRGIGTTRDGWSIRSLARALDITHTRIIKWQQKGLEIIDYNHDAHGRPHITAITRRNLKVFALAHPEHFADIDPKRLKAVFKDKKYISLCTNATPLHGRTIAVVRLDCGDVYWSAAVAGDNLNLSSTTIFDCCNRDTSMRNGMDWARLDYPVYIVPRAVRNEFNQLAGKALYELYLQLRSLDGYSKTSCLIVAGRIAVQITLWAFNRNIKEEKKGIALSSKQVIIEYWQTRWLENIQLFLPKTPSQSWDCVFKSAKRLAYSAFARWLKFDNNLLDTHLEEFALHWIEEQTKRYLKTSYLPKNYQPTTQLEQADLWAFIFSSNIARIQIRENVFYRLIILKAWQYIDRTNLVENITVDLTSEYSSVQREASQKLVVINNDYQQYYAHFVDYIQKSVNSKEYEMLKLYLDLKLEEASDREIATALNCVEDDVLKIELHIKYLATQYATN